MRLVLLDPNLEHTHGHHALYDRVIGAEAARRGLDTVILGNRRFGQERLGDIPVHPLLETTAYRRFSEDPLFAAFDDVEQGNRAVFGELAALPRDFFHRLDMVVVHTVSHITLMGLVSWIATLPATARPHFSIFLMLPSGVGFGPEGAPDMDDPASAIAYREAFRRARALGGDVTFYASGEQHGRQFSTLAGFDIPSHALLTGFDECASQAALQEDRVLLYAGDAKINKGLGLLPELVARVCPAHPEHDFVIHANPGSAWGEALEVIETLRRIAPDHANLDLRLAPLPAQDYADLLTSSATVLLPYDPTEYRRKSSGVVWEAIASTSLLVVPQDTWLDVECAHWNAPFEPYAGGDVAAAAEALDRAIRSAGARRAEAEAAARKFAAGNGVKALLDQLADHWVARRSGLLDQGRRQPLRVTAGEFGEDGWYELEEVAGTQVRWSTATARLPLVLPGVGHWELTFRGPFCFGEDQMRGARLAVDGTDLPTRFDLDEDGAWSLSCTFTETGHDLPAHTVSLRPGQTNRSGDGDPRDLGLLTAALDVREILAGPRRVLAVPLPASEQEAAMEDGWTRPLENGRWQIEPIPGRDGVIAFRVDGETTPENAATLRAFADGQSVQPGIIWDDGGWQVQLQLPETQVPAVDRIDIDIILAAPARIRMQEAIWTKRIVTGTLQVPDHRPASAPKTTPVTVSETAAPQESRSPRTSKVPTLGKTASKGSGLTWTCGQLEDFDTLSFVNLRVSGAVLDGRPLEDFYVKIMRGSSFYALELREGDGAFQLLREPDPKILRSDEWGVAITLFADHAGACTGPHPEDVAGDVSGLMALLADLPAGVASCRLPQATAWENAASALSGLRLRPGDAAE